jgi:hypothetical protein
MEIGDQWSFSESESSKNPTGDSTRPPDSASLTSESEESFPAPNPGSSPDLKKESEQNDFWIEFQNPEISASTSSNHPQAPMQDKASGDNRVLCWAALLTGNAGLRDSTIEFAQAQFMEWLAQSAEECTDTMAGLPEAFQTIRCWSAIKAIDSPLRFLKTISDNVRSGALSFAQAIERIGRNFGWDEERLFKWEQDVENLAGLRRWLPAFIHAHDYLSAAFPLGIEKLDHLRVVLLQAVENPHRFLEQKVRNEFDRRFLDFKKHYMDSYFLLHEDVLHVMGGMKRDEVKVDAGALRNLELLSGLQHTDQSYLNRVKLLAKWIQHNQCNFPLHQILELYPRCYCNFNPGSHQQPASSAAQINAIIQEGLEYFRAILRRCGHLIMLEVKAEPVDDESLRQITAALSDGAMIPLKAQSIKILNKIIVRNPNEFLSEIRKTTNK